MNRKYIYLLLVISIWLACLWGLTPKTGAYGYGTGPYGTCEYGGEIGNAALSFSVNTTSISLNNINTTTTKTATATFDVALFCSTFGYTVTINGATPSNGSHSLSGIGSPAASSVGTEQYGINLVANSSPSVGADPTGGSGLATADYGTTNTFKYVSGDTIASAASYSEQTTFTISFIANVSGTTPADTYSGTETLICTATF